MKPNTIIVLGVVVVVIGIGFFFARGGSAPSVTPEPSAPVVVAGQETATPDTTSTPGENQETPAAASPQTTTQTPTPSTPKPTTSSPKPVTTTPPPSPYGALVTFTDSGFRPIRVSITEGQTVRFLNQSTEHDMWVASNIHPMHAGYLLKSSSDCLGSSFDQCEAVGTGEYWDFKFDAVGSWEYHNHMRPVEGGEITVVAKE